MPSETNVSMVAEAWRAAATAARWNGHAPQVATGTVNASAAHCHSENWVAGTIDITITGVARTAHTASRSRSVTRCG